jgi:hypothetical protein
VIGFSLQRRVQVYAWANNTTKLKSAAGGQITSVENRRRSKPANGEYRAYRAIYNKIEEKGNPA